MTAEQIINSLGLMPHPKEGGFFKEIYRSHEKIAASGLPERYQDDRVLGTAIYYLLTAETFSEMHRLRSDEIFHFYLGDPVEMLHLFPDTSGRIVIHGNDLANGMQPQVIVPAGVWQGARLVKGGSFALLGTTVSPGFEYSDYETGNRKELLGQYPQYKSLITALTHQ